MGRSAARPGKIIGHKRVFSDRLLELYAKRYNPAYRDKVTVDGEVKHGVLVINALPTSIEETKARARQLEKESDKVAGVSY